MKKYLSIALTLALAALASCGKTDDPATKPDGSKDPGKPSGPVPTVTLTADASFDVDFKAKATLTLSAASTAEIKVKLGNGTVQDGKSKVPADYDKTVTIPAGTTSVEVPLKADVMGLKEGEYQFALKIASAEGATVGDPSVAYVALSYIFLPEVNLYADQVFASSCEATLTAAIAKAHDKDIVIKFEVDAESKASVSFDKTLTIPAGETQASVIVNVTVPEGLAAGSYPVIIKIASIENGRQGASPSATITLNYPFTSEIMIDGEFDDWDNALEWVTPAEATFTGIRTLKLAGSPKSLYIYFEIVEPSPEDFNMYPMPIDIFLDADGDCATGGKLGSIDNDEAHQTPPFKDSGLEWYIENGNVHMGQFYIDFTGGAYKYQGKDGDGIFSGLNDQTGKYGSDEIFGTGDLGDDGVGRIEIKINRKYFEILGLKAAVGIKVMNGNGGWACYGLAPTGKFTADFTGGKVDMALINLPEFNEN